MIPDPIRRYNYTHEHGHVLETMDTRQHTVFERENNCEFCGELISYAVVKNETNLDWHPGCARCQIKFRPSRHPIN